MTLKNNRAPLLCCFNLSASFHSQWWLLSNIKLCASFHFHMWIETGLKWTGHQGPSISPSVNTTKTKCHAPSSRLLKLNHILSGPMTMVKQSSQTDLCTHCKYSGNNSYKNTWLYHSVHRCELSLHFPYSACFLLPWSPVPYHNVKVRMVYNLSGNRPAGENLVAFAMERFYGLF